MDQLDEEPAMAEKKVNRESEDKTLFGNEGEAQNYEHKPRGSESQVQGQMNISAQFENPLRDLPREQLLKDVETFCQEHGLTDHIDAFRKGALVAQSPSEALNLAELDENDRHHLTREHTHKWSQPFALYWLAVMCSLAAAVQGRS